MKKYSVLALSLCLSLSYSYAQVDILGKIKQKNDEKINEAVDKTLDDVYNGDSKPTTDDSSSESAPDEEQTTTTTSTDDHATSQTKKDSTAVIKTYANYDFVAGEKIIFDDNFQSDQDGEFPAHWDLVNGQAIVNKQAGKTSLLIIDGTVFPLIKGQAYLSSEFTVEFDWYQLHDAYGIKVGFNDANGGESKLSFTGEGVTGEFPDKQLFSGYPSAMQYENFMDKWHHVAIAYKNNQLKVYVDAARVLVMPNVSFQPANLKFMGLGTLDNPIIFTNVKIADGGKMNMLDKVMTDGKIITHGILFDVNKATIKPESMGVINQIYQLMKDNASLKFEIDGHTDSDGSDDANMKLSQARADAVKAQLVSMGIDASRLTTKGFGELKPISENASPEGKANNRRVEFIKQ